MPIPYAPKLRLAPLLPAAVALLLTAGVTLALLPRPLAEGAAEELGHTLQLVAPALPLPAGGATTPDPELQARVVELVRGTPYRLTVVALDGAVIADSERSLDQVAAMDNHKQRPEIAGALARGIGHSVRRSDTVAVRMAYAAKLVGTGAGPRVVVRLAKPLSALASLRRHLAAALLGAGALATLVTLLLSAWISHWLFGPLERLIGAAHRMGEGDYAAPVPTPPAGELAVLGRALERIAAQTQAQLVALAAERDHLGATVASMSEGVLVTDQNGQPRLVNPAFRQLFGVAPGAPVASVLGLIRETRLDDLIAAVRGGRAQATAEIESLDPAPRTVALLASRLGGDQGVVVVARDVSEAEHLTRMRRDFVANVSHELKTPLAAIRGFAETLVDGAAAEAATALRFSERILDQCRRLGDLLDDLLTLSRLEGTETFRAFEPIDLRRLVAEAVELIGPAAAARSIALGVEPGPPLIVRGDPEGLLRLLANLLDNAVKYNRPGGRVTVGLARAGAEARVAVADTGIGISAAHLPRIFERFYRVDRGRARDEGGTGLGLAIVKHVAQAHRGRLEVDSEPGVGTTFRVLLPLET